MTSRLGKVPIAGGMPEWFGRFLFCPPSVNEVCKVGGECRVNPVLSMDVLLNGAEADVDEGECV